MKSVYGWDCWDLEVVMEFMWWKLSKKSTLAIVQSLIPVEFGGLVLPVRH